MLHGTFYSIFAGIFGAFGSILAKFIFGRLTFSEEAELMMAGLIAFALSNLFMWWTFTRSLRLSSNTMKPLITNMGTNFILTGLSGSCFFAEVHSWKWWLGLSFVISGLSIVAFSSKQEKKE